VAEEQVRGAGNIKDHTCPILLTSPDSEEKQTVTNVTQDMIKIQKMKVTPRLVHP
jgi:hypothetical protein